MASAKKKPPKAKIDTISQGNMHAHYGFALAFMNSDPELKHLFKQAVKNTWSTDEFTARLRNTQWFQTHSASVRNAIIMQTSDPKSYAENVDKMTSQVKDAWGKAYGMDAAAGVGDAQMRQWGETAFRMGWSSEQLLDHMGSAVNFQQAIASDTLGGSAAQTHAQLKELAAQYGVDPGNTWMAQNLSRLMTGDDTMEGVQARVRDMAKNQYQAFADQIDGGHTVEEIASPYMTKMADLLEMDPSSVSLKDPTIQKALTGYRDQKGRPMAQSLNDFANAVRQDTRWGYTANAKQQVAEVGSQLLRSFGLLA